MKMEGKRYIPKVKALLNIPNIVDAGKIYNLNELKNWYPFLDFKNKEYFQEIFEGAKFKVGDKVRFIGKIDWRDARFTYQCKPSPKKSYKIVNVTPQVKGNLVYFVYDIVGDEYSSITVNENEIEAAPDKWIVSFSASKDKYHPDVHQIDYQGYAHKIKGTWKEMFLFNTSDEANACADLFAKHSIKEIMEKFAND